MEQFSVEAFLKATDSGFVKTFKDAQEAVKTFDKNSNSTMMAVGGIMKSTGATMTKFVTAPLIGAGIAAAKVGGDFEAQMSRVKAISGATGDSFEQLEQQAIDLGAKTAFSAKESAEGMENLASAGFNAQEIMAAMPGLLDLAAVSGGDVSLASENAATALRGFGLEADQAGHVADVFARAAADTNAEVGDMGEAMKYIAPVANAMGISLEETAAAVGIMSDAGVKGSQAGTTLRGALSRLARPTDAMRNTMDNLGISFYDAEGNMKPLKTQIGLLKGAFKGLTPEQQQNALVTLYGQESLSGMMALVDKGPDKLGSLTNSLKDSNGAADEMARTMQDNMNSSIEQMMGAFESAGIVIQKIIAPAIKKVADAISGLVEKFVNAPESVQRMVVVIGLIVAALGPVILAIGTTIIWISKLKVAFGVLGTTFSIFKKLGAALGFLTSPIFLVIAAVALLVVGFIYLWNTSEGFRNFWIGLWEGIKKAVGSAIEWIQNAWKSTGEWFSELWEGIKSSASSAWTSIQEAPGKAVSAIKGKWNDVKTYFSNLWEGIKESAAQAWENVKQGALNIVDGIKQKWEELKSSAASIWDGIVSNFQKAIDFIMKYIEPLVTSFKNSFSSIVNLVKVYFTQMVVIAKNIWEIIKSVVMGPALFIIDLITGDFGQLKEDWDLIWTTIKESAMNIWNALQTFFFTVIQTIVTVATSLWSGLLNTLSNIWSSISYQASMIWIDIKLFFTNLWIDIKYGAMQMWLDFKYAVIQTWIDVKYKAIEIWNNLKQWFIRTIDTIVQTSINTWNDFKQGTINLFNNTIQGAKNAWTAFKQWIGNLIETTKNNAIQAWENLRQNTINAFNNLVSGAQEAWARLKQGVSETIENVKKWFNKIKDIDLLEAGKAIMSSLFDGLKEKWKGVQDFVGGIGDWIREHKGPIQYDRKLLIPAGNAIMESLNAGLMNGFGMVKSNVGSMAGIIADTFSSKPEIDLAANLKKANSNINTQVEHKVNMSGSSKPAVFNVNLGKQSFRAFVDDISQAIGEGADLNLEF
jgi:TP901 family phage tail tape measure protein